MSAHTDNERSEEAVDVPRLVRLLRDHEVNPEDLRETIAAIEEASRFVDNRNRLHPNGAQLHRHRERPGTL